MKLDSLLAAPLYLQHLRARSSPGTESIKNEIEYVVDRHLLKCINIRSNCVFINRKPTCNPKNYIIDVTRHKLMFTLDYSIAKHTYVQPNTGRNSESYRPFYGTESAIYTLSNTRENSKAWKRLLMLDGVKNI